MKLFSKEEVRDLVISVLVITFIFSYVGLGGFGLEKFHIYLLVVILAFACHELAHKFVAMRFGCAASYKMWTLGLIFALILTLATGGRFVFIAPGAVVILPFKFLRGRLRRTRLTNVEMGWIGLAGPIVNLVFAVFFRIFQGDVFGLLFKVNAWLAFFNLLPIPPLDGSKIMRWNIMLWVIFFLASILLIWF